MNWLHSTFSEVFFRRLWQYRKLMFAVSLAVLGFVAVFPETLRRQLYVPESSPEFRLFLIIGAFAVLVFAGWLNSFGVRNYAQFRYVRYFVQSIFLTPVLIALAAFGLFAFVPQMQEIYVSMIAEGEWLQAVWGAMVLLLLCAFLGCWQRRVGDRLLLALYSDHGDLAFDGGLQSILRFKGVGSALFPLLGVATGLLSLYADVLGQTTRGPLVRIEALVGARSGSEIVEVREALSGMMWILPGSVVVLAIVLWFAFRWLVRVKRRIEGPIVAVGVAFTAVMFVLPPLWPEETLTLARAVGPLAVIGATLLSIATVFYGLSLVSVGTRLPFTGIVLLLLAGFLSLPLLFPDKKLKTLPVAAPKFDDAALHNRFVEWLDKRPDRQFYIDNKRPYPVFVVAVSGGGIYAASSAAKFLAELQDECSRFGQHVFAISGVSGGAVGATLFNALAAADPGARTECSPSETRRSGGKTSGYSGRIEHIIRSDHLSPVVAVLLGDVARKLLLFGHAPGTVDRANMLERSFARSFADAVACDGWRAGPGCRPWPLHAGKDKSAGLTIPFAGHWAVDKHPPALLLNTTWSETGLRVAFSPFPLHKHSDGTLFNFEEIVDFNKLVDRRRGQRSLIEAAMVSARFPGIVPAWVIEHKPDGAVSPLRWNFVDGGYVDNSGATTAVEIYQQLARYLPAPPGALQAVRRNAPFEIDLRLILLTDSEPARSFENINGTRYSDTLAPIYAMFNVRSELSGRAITRTIEQVEPGKSRSAVTGLDPNSRVWLVNLEQNVFPLPLGWKISGVTNNLVTYLLGHRDNCKPELLKTIKGEEYEVRRAVEAVVENSCIKKQVLQLVQGQPPAP